MRHKQILWRIFFWFKRRCVGRFCLPLAILYDRRIKDISFNDGFKFFAGVDVIKGGVNSGGTSLHDKSMLHDAHRIKKEINPVLRGNNFCFLNKRVTFSGSIEWHGSGHDKLWMYNLHYLDCLVQMGILYLAERDARIYQRFRALVVDWISMNRVIGQGVGWEPYPVSLRIVNLLYAFGLFYDGIKDDPGFMAAMLESIAMQSEYLSNNIERHVCRNHLVKNGKALFMSGMFLHGERTLRWAARGKAILIGELKEQVLDDGGHYERSPMYHSIVLQDYLEAFILAQRNGVNLAVEPELGKMLEFLTAVIHPDNKIPLFNDSAFGIAKEPGELLEAGSVFIKGLPGYGDMCKATLYTSLLTGDEGARMKKESLKMEALTSSLQPSNCSAQPVTMLKDSGFYVIRSSTGSEFMIVNCKSPSPAYLPGHSHADMLSYELSVGGKRFLVDSGVSNYVKGAARDYYRSTRAHNTLTVNGQSQTEMWDIFGVGRRAVVDSVRLDVVNNNAAYFEGVITGFPGVGVSHERSILFIDDRFWFIFDTMSAGHADSQSYRVENYIHIHPDRVVDASNISAKSRRVTINGDGGDDDDGLVVSPARISTYRQDSALRFKVAPGGKDGEQWGYSPEFGGERRNNVIVIESEGLMPIHTAYLLYPFGGGYNAGDLSAECTVTYRDGLRAADGAVLDVDITTPAGCYLVTKDDRGVCVNKV